MNFLEKRLHSKIIKRLDSDTPEKYFEQTTNLVSLRYF